jgi:hypothetical protein
MPYFFLMTTGCLRTPARLGFFLVGFFLVGYFNCAVASTMVIKYPKFENELDARHQYQRELIKLILEQTRAEFGDYKIEQTLSNNSGVKRHAILIGQGEQINLLWNSPGTVIAHANVIPIPVDILRGLLGYRICLISRNNRVDFSSLTDVTSLQKISIGQGRGWSDVDIFHFNNIDLVLSPTLDSLLGMVAANRFDCLLLGAAEIEGIYQENIATMHMLTIEPSLAVYYDFPTYFYISEKFPKIAERFLKGMNMIQENGEFEQLFNRYYKNALEKLNMKSRHTICLRSPYLPLANQCPQ